MTPSPIVGAVLAGGASTRFGRDKAQVVVDGTTMLRRVLASMAPHCRSLVVVGADPPADLLAEGSVTVRRIDDVVPGGGALSGVHAVLHAALAEPCAPSDTAGWVLVAACDMPFLTPATWTPIVRRARAIDASGERTLAVVPASVHGLEPLAAAYRPSLAADAHRALVDGRRSLRALLASVPHVVVPAEAFRGAGERDPFTNVNRPEDLEGASVHVE